MHETASELNRVALLLPDVPRWVEARSMLLSGQCDLFGLNESERLSVVVASPALELAVVIGLPDRDAIIAAVQHNNSRGPVLASQENHSLVARALPDWHSEPALLHILPQSTRLPSTMGRDVRVVTRAELEIASLPGELKEELLNAAGYSPVVAAFESSGPVSFCYAGAETETLWDISIDTIEGSRRRGHARLCVSFLVDHMRGRGKEPVWGALESNVASMKLAAKLGFTPQDRLFVFEHGREDEIPFIDIDALVNQTEDSGVVAEQIALACRDYGFFYIHNHGVAEELQSRLEEVSREFFDQDLEEKLAIRMATGGAAWRGYFPVGEELTSGVPDEKEGIYFGAELTSDDPRNGLPMHGPNLFPTTVPGFRETIIEYMSAMTELSRKLMRGISLSLGLEGSYFEDHYTTDPLVLFRIFNYPPSESDVLWGVAEHTDYGLLTILKQDDTGGLEVRLGKGWIKAPPIPGTFICNIGDMLDRMTGGRYRSTPHRVRNLSGRSRLSFPFFFDPNFDAEVRALPGVEIADNRDDRWDRASVHEFRGTYGEYLLGKVAKVFPDLGLRMAQTPDSSRQSEGGD